MNLAAFDLPTASLEPGTVLLEASAGTGKTYALIGMLLRLLLEGRIERLDQALVVTFTVAATDELKTRLRTALQTTLAAVHTPCADAFFAKLARMEGAEQKLTQALAAFDQIAISTIHGFCKRLLEEAAFESQEPFSLEFAADPLPLLARAAADALRGNYHKDLTARGALLQRAQLTPDRLVELYRLWQRHPNVALQPNEPAAEQQVAAVDAALQSLQPLCTDDAIARITQLVWNKVGNPYDSEPAMEIARFRERLARCPALVLPLLLHYAPSSYEGNISKKRTKSSTYAHAFFHACDQLQELTTTATQHLTVELLHAMHARLEAGKRRDNVLSFDDLLARTHQALKDPARRPILLEALRAQYQVGLIDEFQDTDSLQYEIFADCFAQRTLFLIGDPKQAIYGFRGADLRTYLQARDDAVRGHTLTTNYRSGATLVAAIDRLWRPHPHAFLDDRITVPHVHAKAAPGTRELHGDGRAALHWRFVPFTGSSPPFPKKAVAEALVVADVAAEIVRLLRSDARLDGRPLRPQDIAILTRTNRQAIAVQEALRAVAVPSAIGKAGDIFDTDELIELQRFLQAVLHPGDLMRVRAAMSTRWWGFTASKLLAVEGDDDAFDQLLDRLAVWRQLWLRSGFIVMQERALVDLNVHARFLAMHAGERRLTNFRQLFELLHEAEHTHRLSPEGLLEWLQHERGNQEDIDYTLRELRLESDEDAAKILTVHGSKGLEYEVVFCPFLWDAKAPRTTELAPTEAGHDLEMKLGKDDPAWDRVAAGLLAEELRLSYVAMTRAKRRCYVHWGALASQQGGVWRSALSWLLFARGTVPGCDAQGKPDARWLNLWYERTKSDAMQWRTALAELVATSDGTMHLVDVPARPAAERLPPPPVQSLQPARRPIRQVQPRALHSFSSLVAAVQEHELRPEVADASPTITAKGNATGIFAFARGPLAGQCLHTILEQFDFAEPECAANTQLVRSVLAANALLDADAHAGPIEPVAAVQRAFTDLAAANARPDGPTIAQLCSGARQVEWQFALPMHQGELRQLQRAFANNESLAAQQQSKRLATLPMRRLNGFLVGFVDLVVEHDGRFWVIDWKSNHLGNDAADYSTAALAAAMFDHDYVLQYHLYVLALHRHLRSRLANYDYERHMGGVVYAFLRGAVPGSACGMYYDRVPWSLVVAMDQWALGEDGGPS